MLTKAQYGGIMGGIIGGLGVAVWQWRRLEAAREAAAVEHERGEIIFSNTPHPSNTDQSQRDQGTLKGTDTLATTNAEDVDKARRITM